ncbi:hypothetical protein A45J_0926 [hot springs metagenome]|uniref:Leucine-binding protein domain-containing protein n=1 Tax=hot springs metagenome TaxID=433727 RepID=A0A5J4L2W4_9ZZZZ
MKKSGLFVLKLVLFCLLSSVYAEEPIKIGVSLGLTGRYSEMSDMQMKGFKLWEHDINKKGGLLGRKVKVIIHDDKSDPLIAKNIYEDLILKERCDFVFGPYSSQITEAVVPITEKHHYPLLTSGASADRLWQKGYRYVFGVYTPASKYTIGFLELIAANNLNNIAIVYADDIVSIDIAEGAVKWAKRFGLKVVLMEMFKKGTRDLKYIALKVKDSNADALIVCGHLDESIDMRKSLKGIGWYPKVYYASVGAAMQEYYDALGIDANYTFSSSQWEPYTRFPGSREFTDSFIKKYNAMPSYHAATAYAGGQILEAAIKKANSFDRAKIHDILLVMDIITIIGRYGVYTDGMQKRHFNLIIQWQNGKKEIVWPDEIRTARPIFK